jgi:hypothetical protein
MNSHEDFPIGGGRSLNGGFNTGGGIVVMSSRNLDKAPYFQSTLEHEIGHSFGLPHVDVYGYDMEKNDSLMSYNMDHRTNGFNPAKSLAILIPEDIRGLALNKRVFGKLLFDPARDIPSGYSISPWMSTLGPMIIPGQPDSWIKATTSSGETYKSHVKEIAEQDWIEPSSPEMGFDYTRMWSSAKSPDGWVSVDLTFPFAVNLNGIGIHSEHSGKYHPVKRVKIQVWDSGGYRDVYAGDINSINDYVSFPFTTGQNWRLFFKAGKSGMVVLRGLRYFSGELELFPPLIPYIEPPSP